MILKQTRTTIAQNIEEIDKKYKLTQVDLSEKVGVRFALIKPQIC